MRNFSLHLFFAVLVGTLGDRSNGWGRNNADRNVIGIMNEVIEKTEHTNEVTGHHKFKSAGTWQRNFSQILFTRCSANFTAYTETYKMFQKSVNWLVKCKIKYGRNFFIIY
jgi:hypothetical protein